MSPNSFFIFSLPRSGSAWLSTFLTYDGVFCYHEPLAERESLEMLFKRPGLVGAVDTLAWTRPDLRGFRSFVLKRDDRDIEASSRECGVQFKVPGAFHEVTADMPVIDYHKLDQIEYLAKVWTAITHKPFDRERALQLIDMNIQRDFDRLKKKAPQFAHLFDSKKRL